MCIRDSAWDAPQTFVLPVLSLALPQFAVLLRALAELSRQSHDEAAELSALKLVLEHARGDEAVVTDAAERLVTIARSASSAAAVRPSDSAPSVNSRRVATRASPCSRVHSSPSRSTSGSSAPARRCSFASSCSASRSSGRCAT